jgi:hypothetical protein
VSRHVSAEALALRREGAVSARKAGRIAAHLSTCAQCTEIDTELAAVPAMLAATSLPPMPEALSQRVQMAIAGEAQARVMASAAPGTAPSGADVRGAGLAGSGAGSSAGTDADEPAQIPGRPDLPERRRGGSGRFRTPGWSSPLLLRGLAAAGAVVIIAGAGLLLAHGQNSPESSGSGSGGAGAPAQQSPRNPAAAAGHAVHASGQANGPISLSYHLKGKIATARAMTTRENFTRANMAPLVRKAVASVPPIGKVPEPGTTARTTERPIASKTIFGLRVPTLAGCLTGLAGGRTVLVADIARYLGQPATIVVLKPLTGSHVLDVVVVGFGCSQASPDIIAQVTVPAG